MSARPTRNRMQITRDFLRLIRDGTATKSQLALRLPLSQDRLGPHLKFMLANDLIATRKDIHPVTSLECNFYSITPRGELMLDLIKND